MKSMQTNRHGSLLRCLWLLPALAAMEVAIASEGTSTDKVLFDFEQDGQLSAFGPDAERDAERRLSLAAPEVTAANKALKIVFTGEGSPWPGIATSQVPRDWSAYEALKFEAHSINPLPLSVRIDDDKSVDHASRFGFTAQLSERRTLVQIPMEDIARSINPKNVTLLCIFLTDPPAGTTIYIDNISLGPLEAQKVEYLPPEQRKDAPYTYQVATPVAWKVKPLPGGPLKIFTIPSVAYGRETVELGQRLDAEFGTVSWDRNWGQNTWGFGDHYGQRGHRFDFKLVQKYLAMELAGPNQYDVYVIRTPVGWKWFPQAAREGLLERVKNGAGLVLVRPFSGDEQFDASDLWSISALTHCQTDTMVSPSGYMQLPETGGVTGQAWKATQPDHYIVKDLPLDLLPFEAMAHQQYKVAPEATVLVESAGGDPIVAVKPFGKGRVVTVSYRAFDMTPWVDQAGGSPPPVDYAYWEVGYALVARCVLWAAGREVPLDLPEAFIRQARAESVNPLKVETADTVKAGEPIHVTVSLAGDSAGWQLDRAELRDTYGRIIEQATPDQGKVTLPSARVGTWAAQVVAHAVNGEGTVVTRTADVVLTPPKAVWNDYEIIMWPNDRLPWQRPLIYEHMRQWGCTATLDPGWRNDALMRERLVNGMRIVPHGVQRQLLQINPDRFAEQKQNYELTKDKKYLHRFMCISDPEVRASEEKLLRERTARLAKLRPLAYCIGEEDSITSYRAELDLCFAPATLAKFRKHLQSKYEGDLARLNQRWQTSFESWEAVMPMTSDEAKAHGNFAPWAEHRSFMDDEWLDIYLFYLDILRQEDHPDVLMGTSGTQIPTPHDGQDWYKLMPAFEWLSSYTYSHQDEMHLHFAPRKPYITAATGYGVSAERARHLLWDRLFHGNAGAIVFWWVAIQNPDLSLCQAGKDLGAVLAEMQGGAGRLVFEADRLLDRIAVHYSIPSMQAAWITTGSMDAYTQAVDQWWKALQELGYQPKFVASQQIEQGELTKRKFRALIMPRSVALSAQEKQQIDAMVEAGGIVLGWPDPVGVYDLDLAKHEAPVVPTGYQAINPTKQSEEVGKLIRQAGVDPPVIVQSVAGSDLTGLEIIRFALDDTQMVGILRPPVGTREVVGPDGVIQYLPDESGGKPVERVRIPVVEPAKFFNVRTGKPVDMVALEDGRSAMEVDLRAGDATLLSAVRAVSTVNVELASPQVKRGGQVSLKVACDAPSRRVIRVEVRQPDGSNAPWLTRNVVVTEPVTITAAVAMSDPVGEWSVKVTNVLTGASIGSRFVVE